MPNGKIEEFAETLVLEIRDAAIRESDIIRRPDSPCQSANRWRKLMATGPGPDSIAARFIPECVDSALFWVLRAVDEEMIRLQFVTADGGVVDLNREGLSELAGWYLGTESFREKYSKERFSELGDGDDIIDRPALR